jgi:phosphatidylglycerophosphate synthase
MPALSVPARWSIISAGLGALVALSARAIGRRYGRAAGWRYAGGSALALSTQQILLGLLVRRDRAFAAAAVGTGEPLGAPGAAPIAASPLRLGLADAVTLSRGGAAALLAGLLTSGVRDRRGLAGRLGWGALLWGVTLSDWLDGPLARRLHTVSRWGPLLDLELDSWLTLSAALCGAAWGGLPRSFVAAPVARYALLLAVVRRRAYARADLGRNPWARATGTAQMATLVLALAPIQGPWAGNLARAAARPVAGLQLAALAVLRLRLNAPMAAPTPAFSPVPR